jgi:hypothetical protein
MEGLDDIYPKVVTHLPSEPQKSSYGRPAFSVASAGPQESTEDGCSTTTSQRPELSRSEPSKTSAPTIRFSALEPPLTLAVAEALLQLLRKSADRPTAKV